MIKRGYTDADARKDAAWPRGFAPEDHMPPEIRRAERLRTRETGYRLAETLIRHGVPVEVAALLMAVPHGERSEQRQWAVRVDEAELAGNTGCARCQCGVAGSTGTPWSGGPLSGGAGCPSAGATSMPSSSGGTATSRAWR